MRTYLNEGLMEDICDANPRVSVVRKSGEVGIF